MWEMAVARLCAWGDLHFDTPTPQQLQYVGDTRIQALISLYMTATTGWCARPSRTSTSRGFRKASPPAATRRRWAARPSHSWGRDAARLLDGPRRSRLHAAFSRPACAASSAGTSGTWTTQASSVPCRGGTSWQATAWHSPPGAKEWHSATITAVRVRPAAGGRARGLLRPQRGPATALSPKKLSSGRAREGLRPRLVPGLAGGARQPADQHARGAGGRRAAAARADQRVLGDKLSSRRPGPHFGFYVLEALRRPWATSSSSRRDRRGWASHRRRALKRFDAWEPIPTYGCGYAGPCVAGVPAPWRRSPEPRSFEARPAGSRTRWGTSKSVSTAWGSGGSGRRSRCRRSPTRVIPVGRERAGSQTRPTGARTLAAAGGYSIVKSISREIVAFASSSMTTTRSSYLPRARLSSGMPFCSGSSGRSWS